MFTKKIVISTRPLSAEILSLADINSIRILVHSFIDTEPVSSQEVQNQIKELADQNITAIFTSMNAVESVRDQLNGNKPSWKTAAIGQTTKELINELFGEENLIATGNNAAELANNLVDKEGPFVFFCGDQRRDELPDIFTEHNKALKEITVYKTIKQSVPLEDGYDGILFYSPSAVESFFESNQLNESVIVFAIGKTTAETVRNYVNNDIILTEKPGKENLVKTMIEYYNEEQ